ncbi:hypothetical protein [Arthrobacter sp. Edens01]|uniref:hypothetical protein n=1 Tax=Arthrobacter sp. Edens01 TaxID=1732020 RepID=UPI00128E9CA8|nr:hypothetical protein [Arthrobacter sp. Edens01]
MSKTDAPWAGGIHRFTASIPMKVLLEVKNPIFLPFRNNIQTETGLNTANFQRGMSLMSDDVATRLNGRLFEQYILEEEDEV